MNSCQTINHKRNQHRIEFRVEFSEEKKTSINGFNYYRWNRVRCAPYVKAASAFRERRNDLSRSISRQIKSSLKVSSLFLSPSLTSLNALLNVISFHFGMVAHIVWKKSSHNLAGTSSVGKLFLSHCDLLSFFC